MPWLSLIGRSNKYNKYNEPAARVLFQTDRQQLPCDLCAASDQRFGPVGQVFHDFDKPRRRSRGAQSLPLHAHGEFT